MGAEFCETIYWGDYMFFKKYNIYENRLSEQLDDGNPYKKKLIQMETPSTKHPIYFLLVYGLYIYCLLFLVVMLYKKSYGYDGGIVVMLWTTFCLYFTKGKSSLTLPKKKRIFILGCTIVISILLEIPDKISISFSAIGEPFLFFIEINQKSYIALTILAFCTVGISLCYPESICEVFKHLRNFQQRNKWGITVSDIVDANYDFAFVMCLISPYLVYVALDDAQDAFRLNLKLLSPAAFLEGLPYIYQSFLAKRYLTLFKKAQKF